MMSFCNLFMERPSQQSSKCASFQFMLRYEQNFESLKQTVFLYRNSAQCQKL